MNAEIGHEADLALRKQIERAVRPVRAGPRKKLAMREELFAHLKAIHADELTRHADNRAALTAALQRFGEPAALTAELNASVSLAEKFAYYDDLVTQAMMRIVHRCLVRRPGDSQIRFALRCFGTIALANVPLICPMFLIAILQARPGDLTGFTFLPTFFLFLTMIEAAALLGVASVSLTLNSGPHATRWLWAAGKAVLWSLIEVAIVILFLWSAGGAPPPLKEIIRLGTPWVPILSPFLLLAAWIPRVARQHYQKYEVWTSLDIDE